MKPLKPQNQLSILDTLKKISIPKSDHIIYFANMTEKKIQEYNSAEEDNSIIELLKKWKIYSGILQKIDSVDYVIIFDFIKENFGKLNYTDINTAINLSTANKLEYKKTDESFGSFSCTYVGRILSAYLQYKPIVIHDTREKINKLELTKNNKQLPTNQERETIFKELVFQAWNSIKIYGDFSDWNNRIFDYLYKNKIIIITPEIITDTHNKAIENLKLKRPSVNPLQTAFAALDRINNKTKKSIDFTKEEIVAEQSRIVVLNYFQTVDDISKFIDEITFEKIAISEK